MLVERRAAEPVGEAAIPTPVVGHRAAAVRDHEAERREPREQVALDELHEHGRVGVEVVRAGAWKFGLHDVETWIMAGTSSSTSAS